MYKYIYKQILCIWNTLKYTTCISKYMYTLYVYCGCGYVYVYRGCSHVNKKKMVISTFIIV